jgi:hypothetical protein
LRDTRPRASLSGNPAVSAGPALAVPIIMLETALAFTIVLGTMMHMLVKHPKA